MVNLIKSLVLAVVFVICIVPLSKAEDLNHILQSGTLRHLGIPYANFITSEHEGLDVGLMKAFARYLGVKYLFVESSWKNIVTDLTGEIVEINGDDITITGTGPKRGDIISTGFTVLPWRKKIVLFSEQTFPSGIWLVARNDSSLKPIKPTGNIDDDITKVKEELTGISVLGLKESCLAPGLYGIDKVGAEIKFFPPDQDIDGMIPSILAHNADSALVDVPVALIALAKWPGKIKVIGPVSAPQKMSCAFAQDSPQLQKSFDTFFSEFKKSGGYRKLVEEYYPSVFTYYPNFLAVK